MISRGTRLGRRFDNEDISKRLWRNNVITFSNEGLWEIQTPYDDAIVVLATIANYDVQRILVDNGSSTNILFYDAFINMNLSPNR